MVKVVNIKYEVEPIEPKNANFLKCLEYAKLMTDDYKKYLPDKSKESVSFELHDTTSDMANAIRRFLHDEIEVYSMTLNESDIDTDDPFILTDHIKQRIEAVPITQDIEKYNMEKFTINLSSHNLTTEVMDIYTRDFEILYDGKKFKGDHFFSNNIHVFSLKTTKKIKISNIKIIKGIAKDNYGKFVFLSNIKYKILDTKPLEKTKYKRTGESSLNSTPSKFLFKLTNHRNIDPKKIMIMCLDSIINRIENLNSDVAKIKETETNYVSNLIKLENVGNFMLLHLINEYWTLSNLVSRYCYLQDKDIEFVCSSIIHPTTEVSIVKIKHKNYLKIILNALNEILKDLKTIKSSFK